MHRNALLNLLNNYSPFFEEEKTAKKNIIEFVKNNPDCFERHLKKGHITASSFIVNSDNTKTLLMHHKKLNIWVQLGGHADGLNDVLEVAIKEACEESGLDDIRPVSKEIFDLDIHKIPANGKDPEHLHYDIRFLLKTDKEFLIQKNDESNGLCWFNQDEKNLPTKEKSILRMFQKWKKTH